MNVENRALSRHVVPALLEARREVGRLVGRDRSRHAEDEVRRGSAPLVLSRLLEDLDDRGDRLLDLVVHDLVIVLVLVGHLRLGLQQHSCPLPVALERRQHPQCHQCLSQRR